MVGAAPRAGLWIERVLVVPILAGLAYTIVYLNLHGHLPQPYFYEPSGTFMDFTAPATYAHNRGAYDVFASVYPPLSFLVLKFLSWGQCYGPIVSEQSRDCDTLAIGALLAIYALNTVLIALTFRKLDRTTALPRVVALCAGLSMTYALERGNVLLLCFTCLILAYGPLVKSARLRWLFAGLAVNFKVYLIGTIFAQLLKRRWRWFEGAMIATLLVYLVSFALYGEGSPAQIYANIVAFAAQGEVKPDSLLDLWYPSSLQPALGRLQDTTFFPIITTLGSRPLEIATLAIRILVAAVTLSIVLAAAAALWRPKAVPMHRLVLLSIGIATINSEVGGYIQMILIFFVFMERWKGIGRPFAIVIAYLLCIALDVPLSDVPPVVRDSYLGGRFVIAEYSISLGIILRPLLVHVMLFSLAMVTLRQAWDDARRDGWQSPFRSWQTVETAA